MATIKDVAKQASVSISTVSHVLNKTRFVSDDAIQRVYKAVELLNYRPSAVARSLKTSRTHTIGMLTGSNANPFFAEVIHGAEAYCYELGYHLILCNSENDLKKQASYLKTLSENRIDGLLVMSGHSESAFFELLKKMQSSHSECPVVVIDCVTPDLYCDTIMDDSEEGGYEATRFLIENNHRAIGCVCGPKELSPSRERLAGFYRAMSEANLEVDPRTVIEGQLTAESGYQSALRLLDRGKPPTALFVGNDLMAMGVMCALQSNGYRVPEDVSVIGYDDIELAAYTSPALTTMHQSKGKLGRFAAKTLVRRISTPETKTEVTVLKSTRVERQSVCRYEH